MYKYLILIISLVLNSCSGYLPNKGQCVVSGNYEILRIVEVGEYNSYLVQNESCTIYNWHSLRGGFSSTDCFDTFKHCNELNNAD